METTEDAQACVEALNQQAHDGKNITVAHVGQTPVLYTNALTMTRLVEAVLEPLLPVNTTE
jgi:hypothetical protein